MAIPAARGHPAPIAAASARYTPSAPAGMGLRRVAAVARRLPPSWPLAPVVPVANSLRPQVQAHIQAQSQAQAQARAHSQAKTSAKAQGADWVSDLKKGLQFEAQHGYTNVQVGYWAGLG